MYIVYGMYIPILAVANTFHLINLFFSKERDGIENRDGNLKIKILMRLKKKKNVRKRIKIGMT